MYSSFLLYDTTLRVLCIRFGTFRYHIDTFYKCTSFFNKNFQHTASFTFIFTRVYVNCIAFFICNLLIT